MTETLREDSKDSVVLKENNKKERSWEAKVYGDTTIEGGVDDMKKRLKALVESAIEVNQNARSG